MRRLRALATSMFESLVERHAGYLEVGPVYVTSRKMANSDAQNAFQLGRDYQDGLAREEVEQVRKEVTDLGRLAAERAYRPVSAER